MLVTPVSSNRDRKVATPRMQSTSNSQLDIVSVASMIVPVAPAPLRASKSTSAAFFMFLALDVLLTAFMQSSIFDPSFLSIGKSFAFDAREAPAEPPKDTANAVISRGPMT